MTSDEHKAAAEQALADADGHTQPLIPLARAITHALLALTPDTPTCTHCNDHPRPGHICAQCGLYSPEED